MVMSKVSLRRSGGSLIITVPAAFAVQNNLEAGSEMSCQIEGDALVLKPLRKKFTLEQLLAETPEHSLLEEWENMPAVGSEFGADVPAPTPLVSDELTAVVLAQENQMLKVDR
jgi:antitoxin component of MazEF toxin-antitoxin module